MPKQFASSLRQNNWSEKQRGGNALRIRARPDCTPDPKTMSRARLQSQTTISPKLPLGAKTMGRLDHGD
jgi:hypothetical protein